MGVLRIRGEIDLNQFWPNGTADADTTKIKVKVDANAFAYADNGKTFKTTKVFVGAVTKGKGSKPAISTKNEITVRLQGIDAPELHYKASAIAGSAGISDAKRKKFNAANKERRQRWAESATVALAVRLAKLGKGPLACEFVSLVDRPTDVVDVYGRFVGNIRVGVKLNLDINLWLTEEGWALPSFYTSMTEEEINGFVSAAKKGRAKKRVWKGFSEDTSKFESKLLYRRKGPAGAIGNDAGAVLMPKIYRRQVAYRMQKDAGIVDGSFAQYLAAQTGDKYMTVKDYVTFGVETGALHTLDKLLQGKMLVAQPDEIVFSEGKSKLVDKNGKLLVKF